MRLRAELLQGRRKWAKRKIERRQKRTEKIAHQLYQQRELTHKAGNEASDWALAQKIVRNPLRRVLYRSRQTATGVMVSAKWAYSGVAGKTSWEWLELLIVPLLLAGGAFYIDNQGEKRQEAIADERYRNETALAYEREKQETLNIYLEQMKELLLSENLRASSVDSEVRSVARAITTTTIKNLDNERNALVIDFLQESNLLRATDEEVKASTTEAENAKANPNSCWAESL